MATTDFNDFWWHDSVVKNISLDRSTPGYKDEIALDMEWQEEGMAPSSIVFYEVCHASFDLNFNIIAEECILKAECFEQSKEIDLLKERWKGMLEFRNLRLHVIELNSTGGMIKIIADGFRIEEF